MDNESIDNKNNNSQNELSTSNDSFSSATIKLNSKILNSDSTSNDPSVLVTHFTSGNNIIKAEEIYDNSTPPANGNGCIDSNVEEEDEGEIIEYEYDLNEQNSQLEKKLDEFPQLAAKTKNLNGKSRRSYENLNDSTNKYLNMLGEDLLMEMQDLNSISAMNNQQQTPKSLNLDYRNYISDNIAKPQTKKSEFIPAYLNHPIRFLSEFDNHNIDHEEIESNENIASVDETNTDETPPNHNHYDLSKHDLVMLIEQLNRQIELERFEKNKVKEKYNMCILENKKCLSLLEQYNMEREDIMKEYNNLKNAKLKDNKRFNIEIEAISREYSQVMSERDSVHKEMEAMQEQLSKAQERLKKYQRESTVYSSANNLVNLNNFGPNISANNNETLNELINSVNFRNSPVNNNLVNPNNVSNYANYINCSTTSNRQQKCNSVIYDQNLISMEQSLEIDSLKQQLSLLTRQRDEAIIQIRDLHQHLGSQQSETKFNDTEYVKRYLNERINNSGTPSNLRSDEENEILKYELKELLKELDNSNKRRDMAFNERDKMLKERESIRALCDDMRHQRDKAISELAEALHESDELKKAKTVAYRQIQILEDNVNMLEEKLAYLKELDEIKAAKQVTESARSLQKSIEEDFDNWKTLRIDIDLGEFEEGFSLGIDFNYADKIVSSFQGSNEEIAETTDVVEEVVDSVVESTAVAPRACPDDTADFSVMDEGGVADNVNMSNAASYDNSIESAEVCSNEDPQEVDTKGEEMKNNVTSLERLVLISKIDDEGLAYGKLKLFDRILKINDQSVENLSLNDLRTVIANLQGNVTIIVSRHFNKSNDSLHRDSDVNHYQDSHPAANDEVLSTSISLTTSNSNSKEDQPEVFFKKAMNEPGFKVLHDSSCREHQDTSNFSKNMKESAIKKMLLDASISKHYQQNRNNSMGRTSDKNNFDLVSIKKSSLNDLLLETGVYISATKTQTMDGRSDINQSTAMLAIGDRILSINGISLTNKNLYEVMELVDQCKNFNLVIQKITSAVKLTQSSSDNNNMSAIMCNSASSVLTDYLLNPKIIQNPRKIEPYMISQTLSNISSSTSNPKITAKTSKHYKQKFQESNTSKTRIHPRSHIDYSSQNFSTSSQILAQRANQQQKARVQHNVNKQFVTRNRSCESARAGDKLHQTQSTIRGTDQAPLTAEMLHAHQQRISFSPYLDENGHLDSRYEEMIKNFHTHNRKETQILLSPRLKQASQDSLGKLMSSNDVLSSKECEIVRQKSPEKSKRIAISDLMQHTYKTNLNIKRNDEKQQINERIRGCEAAVVARPHRNNTAL